MTGVRDCYCPPLSFDGPSEPDPECALHGEPLFPNRLKTLWRVWLGPRPMPSRYKWYGQRWRMLNPDITVRDVSWHNLPEDLPCSDVMDDLRARCTSGNSTELPTQLADILGYYLTSLGGIYANADIYPVRPIPAQMWDQDFVTYEEKNYWLCVNAFTGGKRNSDFWKFVLEGISESYFSQPSAEMVFTTGPQYMTRRISAWTDGTGGEKPVTVYPFDTVNPLLWKNVPRGEYGSDHINLYELPEHCIGVHDWGHRITGRSNTVS